MSNKELDSSHLAQSWLHSHEEDTPNSTIYRPATYSFPPSRGRKGFSLRPDGTLVASKPGATDRTETKAGTWKLAANKLHLSMAGGDEQKLTIESLEPDRLVVAKSPASAAG
jgi:hypothetical protein